MSVPAPARPIPSTPIALALVAVFPLIPAVSRAQTEAPAASSPEAAPSPAAPVEEAIPTWRVGVLLGAGGLPRALNGGIFVKYKNIAAVGATYGFFPKYEYIQDASLALAGAELEGRYYPFRGVFFVGGGIAYQTIDATVRTFARDRTVTASGPALVVRAGWHWMFRSGLSLGIDVGAQVMISPTLEGDKDRNAREIADIVSSTPLPTLNLLRIGYFL